MSISDKIVCILFYPEEDQAHVEFFNLSLAKSSTNPVVKNLYNKVCKALKAKLRDEEIDYDLYNESLDEKCWSKFPCYVQDQVTLYCV